MKRANQIIIYIFIIAFSCSLKAQLKTSCQWKDRIIADHKNFYSIQNLGKLTIGIGISGVFANSSADQEIQDFYSDNLKSTITDNISKIVKPFGNGRITVPVYLTAVLLGELLKDTRIGSAVGEWGGKCSRAILVGAPPVLVLQVVLGASRPEQGKGSRWHPFKDNNGVSGHSFIGAVPFLTTAKMTDNSYWKYSLYLGSTLTGLSRINDNKHYFSQVLLGWWIGYLAVNSIDLKKSERFALVPFRKGIGVLFYF